MGAFTPASVTYAIAATTSAAAATRVLCSAGATPGSGPMQYVLYNGGTVGAWAVVASDPNVAPIIPTIGMPGNTVWIGPGSARTVTDVVNSYCAAITGAGSTTLYVTAGVGALSGVTDAASGGGSGTVTANQGAAGVQAWLVEDKFNTGQCLPAQSGAGGVLTFTFSSSVNLVFVYINGGGTTAGGTCDPFGGTPSASQGWICADQVGTYIPCPSTTTVKVFALAGQAVNVSGLGY